MSSGSQNDLTPLETLLHQLQPAPAGLNRDQLLFQAGQRAGRHGQWQRSALTGVLGLLLGLVGTGLVLPHLQTPAERIVYVPVPAPELPEQVPPTSQPKPPPSAPEVPSTPPAQAPELAQLWLAVPQPRGGYLGLRDRMLRWGPEMLPAPGVSAGSGERPLSVLDMLTNLAEKRNAF
jgi:hypothetical protein